ncbi:hypothetical protein CDL12_26423 [Handroanthus impetiginosus]|nr:hypothetical protein CDL12_26423 [Handroanthus impetiginosus]
MNFNFSEHSAAFSRAASSFPGLNTHNLSENVARLGRTNNGDEILEVNRFDRVGSHQRNVSSGDLYHLQICSGMGDTGYEACSELIFAPIDRTLPDDAALLSSGFRIFLLGSKTLPTDGQGSRSSANIASAEAYNTYGLGAALSYPCSLLILAFQFPCETYLKDDVASMALKYVQHIISSVRKISLEATSSSLNPVMNSIEANPGTGAMAVPESSYAVSLANSIVQSYRTNLGVEMPGFKPQSTNSSFELIQHHPYAILYFSFTSLPMCLYANQAGLNMLETTTNSLVSLTVDKMLSGSTNVTLSSILPTIMQQGYTIIPPAFFLSEKSRCVTYEQGVVWHVQGPDGSIHGLAFAFVNWSFI